MIFRKIKKIVKNELSAFEARSDLVHRGDVLLSFREFVLPQKENIKIQKDSFLLFS